jgi:hypothetical protein
MVIRILLANREWWIIVSPAPELIAGDGDLVRSVRLFRFEKEKTKKKKVYNPQLI